MKLRLEHEDYPEYSGIYELKRLTYETQSYVNGNSFRITNMKTLEKDPENSMEFSFEIRQVNKILKSLIKAPFEINYQNVANMPVEFGDVLMEQIERINTLSKKVKLTLLD